jgi:cytochrome c556
MRRISLTAAMLFATVAFATIAEAETSPADAIKYRKTVMQAMGAHVAGVFMINSGRVDHPEYLKSQVTALADLGAQGKVLFPAGSGVGDTEALPLIWEEQEQFGKLVAALDKSTADLRDAVVAGDKAATGKALKAVGEACKSCHDRYRKEEKK